MLSIINVLSNTLQNKCATLGMSKNVIISVITTFENLRSDDEFSNVWRKIMHTAEKIGICLQNPSKGKLFCFIYILYILCFHNKIYIVKLLLIYLFDKKDQNDNEGNPKLYMIMSLQQPQEQKKLKNQLQLKHFGKLQRICVSWIL